MLIAQMMSVWAADELVVKSCVSNKKPRCVLEGEPGVTAVPAEHAATARWPLENKVRVCMRRLCARGFSMLHWNIFCWTRLGRESLISLRLACRRNRK